jgi:hypothetical protein
MSMQEPFRFHARRLGSALAIILTSAIGATNGQAIDEGRVPTPEVVDEPRLESIREAVSRATPILVKASTIGYSKYRVCFSCHNQAMPIVALSLARQRGFAIESQTLRAIAEHTEADLNGAVDDYRKGKGQPGGVIRAGYALWTLEAAGWIPDETTAAVASYLPRQR